MINLKPSLKKVYLTCTFVFLLAGNLPSYADEFDLNDVDQPRHAKIYSGLKSARKSNDELLKSDPQFKAFMKDADSLVKQYEMESFIGLRLIHNHFKLEPGQVMAENFEEVKNTPSLVTQRHTIEEAQQKGAIPASWIFTDNPEDGGLLFEASSDPAIKKASLRLQQTPKFFNEMGNLLRSYKLHNLLALAVVERSHLTPKDTQLFLENTYKTSSRSVLQLLDIQNKPKEGFVTTSWGFSGPYQHGCTCKVTVICTPVGCWVDKEHSAADSE